VTSSNFISSSIGQLWFLSYTILSTRIKTQLNTIIFEKTLKRKDVITGGGSKKDEKEKDLATSAQIVEGSGIQPGAAEETEQAQPVVDVGSNGNINGNGKASTKPNGASATSPKKTTVKKDKEEDKDFKTKSQVLNLFVVDVDRISDFANWSFSLFDAPCEIVIGTIFLWKLLGWAAICGILITVFFLPMNHWTVSFLLVLEG
jgi:hypothetical protein